MKNIAILCLSAIVLFGACGNSSKNEECVYQQLGLDCSAPVNTISETEEAAGWVSLFDGRSFTGWHGYNMAGIPAEWSIEDGMITMQFVDAAESQDIITDKEYKSYALSLEYKLSNGANSGIIFQVKEDPAYNYPYETGPEFQVIDDAAWGDKIGESQRNACNYEMYVAQGDFNKPIGEWNHAVLVVDGNKVSQYLNGVKTVEYEKYSEDWLQRRNAGKWADYPDYGKYDEGHISLQNHGTQVWYRSIKLKELK